MDVNTSKAFKPAQSTLFSNHTCTKSSRGIFAKGWLDSPVHSCITGQGGVCQAAAHVRPWGKSFEQCCHVADTLARHLVCPDAAAASFLEVQIPMFPTAWAKASGSDQKLFSCHAAKCTRCASNILRSTELESQNVSSAGEAWGRRATCKAAQGL